MKKEEFDRKGFMQYLAREFDGFDNSFLRETIENITLYALLCKNTSKDELCDFLDHLLPDEVERWEIACFADDSILASYTREEKKAHICAKCGQVIGKYDETWDVNTGLPSHFIICEICHDDMWENDEMTKCESCGEWYTYDVLEDEQVCGQSFCECPNCKCDIVEGMDREEYEKEYGE